MAVTVVAGSVALLPATRLYLEEVLPHQAGSNALLENLSMPAVLDRAASVLAGRPLHLGLASAGVSVAMVGATWWLARERDGLAGRATAFAAFGAVMPIISPVTWTYHLTAELVTYGLLAPWVRRRTAAFWLLVVSYPLMWVGPRIDEWVALIPGVAPRGPGILPWLVLTSLNLWGMVALWAGALLVLRSLPATETRMLDR
jgi:hypothetical protein